MIRVLCESVCLFFFSSRRRHTRLQGDWSSDVCSSDLTRELNDFLSSTRTFELKSKVAGLIRQHGYPMVLNVVLHRLNIDHVGEILEMAEALGAQYVELANTQYYGWAWLDRKSVV